MTSWKRGMLKTFLGCAIKIGEGQAIVAHVFLFSLDLEGRLRKIVYQLQMQW